ncbi:DNA translocase FtsK [Solirubrobacter ginsenosidimutans]|uniref:DNA translocase FtsK n=1 Tax=Solirubrobacter ginsenosidimutans TaxID=490573 RepID=A0A9X3N599_9ACTN|nr:DNA translocase FtsK [Solirubrobacter ginsenosidimutans]MDA0165098.1 DNA translocase FtsK [Solirubrobacter ginsenosidimutans]
MPAAKKKPASKPAARRARRSAPSFHLPTLEQRQLDLIGLGLVALALFFGFLVYAGWDGGRAGSEAVEGLRWLLGAAHYLVPVSLAAAGAILMLRPVLPAVRPFRAGAICLFVSVTLGLSAGTLGVGPGGTRPEWWDPQWVKTRGGMTGETLDWVVTTLAGTIGAHILTVFLFLAGVLLLTGASVAGVIKATSDSVSTTTREMRDAVAAKRPRPRAMDDLATLEQSTRVRVNRPEVFGDAPEFETPDELAPPKPKRAAKKKPAKPAADDNFWSGEERYPDLYGGELPPVEPEPAPEVEVEPEPEPVPELERLAEDPVEDEEGVTRGPAEPVDPEQLTPQGRYRRDVTDSPDFVWELPDPAKLTRSSEEAARPDTVGQEKVAAQLIEALGHFNVEARVIGMVAGPHITRYELRLAPGIKVGKVAQLKDDLAYALAAADIRILAPIPGKQAVGIEVPNARRRIVHLGDVFQAPPADWSPLTVWLGKDVAGRSIGADLAKMPHLLVAGTTGAGKSGAINAMLSSILLNATPHEVRMVLVDPKQVELTHYDSIPHLLTPVITSPKQAAIALQNLVREMEQRYAYMALARTRTLKDLNTVRAGRDEQALPYILCVIDELADLMMVAPADVEDSIIRIAQKARAVGIHLVLATQSPRVDVITGMIKANVPSRIAFAVSSQTDSRVILDQNGAESLLGMGDMLFSPVGSSRLQRIQGAFIDEAQIEEMTDTWRRQGEPELREDLLEEVEAVAEEASGSDDGFDPDEDPLLGDAIRLVAEMQTASTSMLQRRLRLGYTRAGRLIDMLERRGVISGYEGSKPRQVLVTEADLPRVLAALDPQTVPDELE